MSHDFNPVGGDGLLDLTVYDPRNRFQYATTTTAPLSTAMVSPNGAPCPPSALPTRPAAWASAQMPLDVSGAGPSSAIGSPAHHPSSPYQQRQHDEQHQHHHPASPLHQSPSPLPQQHSPFQTTVTNVNSPSLLTDWAIPAPQPNTQDLSGFMPDTSLMSFNSFGPAAFLPPNTLEYLPTTQAAFEVATTLPMENAFTTMSPIEDTTTSMVPWAMGTANWQDFETASMFPADGLPRMGSMGSHSPTGTYLEIMSQPSSSSENGWTMVENIVPSFDAFSQATHNAAIFNPGQTLHLRTTSDASVSDGAFEFGSYEEIAFPPYSPFSPGSDCLESASGHHSCMSGSSPAHSHHEIVSPAAVVPPVPIKTASSSSSSGSGNTSPSRRSSGGVRKSPIAKNTTKVIRRTSTGKKDGNGEKKIGRRRGPLLPEQRKQASEIRKLRACLRCKFLKKTCDKGEPCAGCQPSHARLWQVPCTRIDIKDIGYFMKEWKADYERHLDRGVSIYNVKGFGSRETTMWITHGYGAVLAVPVREVYVADDRCFEVDWVESFHKDQEPIDFAARTEHLDVGVEGVSHSGLDKYLDQHIDEHFDQFINDHFEGTPFITDIFMTAHKYYKAEGSPIIRKALKLVLAYNLTLHITMIEGTGSEEMLSGQIDDEDSKYYGKTLAPVMVNFQIKCAMADMWRELQKDVLEELSALYSSVYSGDRLKNWPTIFMLASILLAVWEEMQFDCHYRVPDPELVKKFCTDMETTPVGVIVGLFHAISQKLPAFTEWDTRRHGQILNNNPAICDALTEVRQHVLRHGMFHSLPLDSSVPSR